MTTCKWTIHRKVIKMSQTARSRYPLSYGEEYREALIGRGFPISSYTRGQFSWGDQKLYCRIPFLKCRPGPPEIDTPYSYFNPFHLGVRVPVGGRNSGIFIWKHLSVYFPGVEINFLEISFRKLAFPFMLVVTINLGLIRR